MNPTDGDLRRGESDEKCGGAGILSRRAKLQSFYCKLRLALTARKPLASGFMSDFSPTCYAAEDQDFNATYMPHLGEDVPKRYVDLKSRISS